MKRDFDDFIVLLENGKCKDCHYCFVANGKFVCADKYYGKELSKQDLNTEKDCYTESVSSYVSRCSKKDMS